MAAGELEEAWHWAGPGAWHREFEGVCSLSFVVFSVLIVASRVARWSLEMLMIALRISGVFGVSGPQEELSEQSREIVFLLADIVSSTCNIYWAFMGVIKCYKWRVFSFSRPVNTLPGALGDWAGHS